MVFPAKTTQCHARTIPHIFSRDVLEQERPGFVDFSPADSSKIFAHVLQKDSISSSSNPNDSTNNGFRIPKIGIGPSRENFAHFCQLDQSIS